MRVLYDHQAFDLQTHGGISRSFIELIKRLDTLEPEIGILCTDNVYAQSIGYKPYDETLKGFITERDFPFKGRLYMMHKAGIESMFRYKDGINRRYSISLLKRGAYDIVHPTYYSDYLLPYIKGKPLVLTVHDMIPELYPQYYTDGNQAQLKRALIPRADMIIAVSNTTKNDIMRFYDIDPAKIRVIHHGPSFTDADTAWRTKQYDHEYLLYVGDRTKYKNFRKLISNIYRVLKSRPELKVICTGKPFDNDEMHFFDGLGIRDTFKHVFAKTNHELAALYHDAKAFIFPSGYEGFGIPAIEAMQCGTIALLNQTPSLMEVGGDAAVYFDINDAKATEETIIHILNMSDAERQTILSRQRERLKLFSWEASADRLTDIYKELI